VVNQAPTWCAILHILKSLRTDNNVSLVRAYRNLQLSTERLHLHIKRLFKVLGMAFISTRNKTIPTQFVWTAAQRRCRTRLSHLLSLLHLMEDLLSLRPVEEPCPQRLVEDLLLQAVAGDLLFQVLVGDLLPQVLVRDLLPQVLAWDLLSQVLAWDLLSQVLAGDLLSQVLAGDLLHQVLRAGLFQSLTAHPLAKSLVCEMNR